VPGRSERLRVLAVSGRLPLPQTDGGRVANFGFLKALALEHDLTVLYPILDASDQIDVGEFNRIVGSTEVRLMALHALPQLSPTRWAAVRRFTVGLFTGVPPRYQSHRHPAMASRLRALSKESDVVVFLDNKFAQYVHYSLSPVILHLQNVDGWSAAAHRPIKLPSRLAHRNTLRQIRRLEGRAVHAAHVITVTSAEEAHRLVDLYGVQAPVIIPSGIDIPDVIRQGTGHPVVGWLGNHEYQPNAEGLVRFIEVAWPSVYRATSAELWIMGADPPASIQKLDRQQGIRVLGYVNDLPDVLSSVSVGVVPLWAGAGVKVKTITMMASGIPTVSTAVGAEGIDYRDSTSLVVANDPAEIGQAIVDLLNDPASARLMGQRARSLVSLSFSWQVTGTRMNSIIADVYSRTHSS
jgi:glycosyltransferase involved in cell wall biosynthesis